jgi:transcriptional regulator with XRE-family HTH domain
MQHPFRAFRQKNDLSIDRVVDALRERGVEISKAQISRIETGEQDPTVEAIRALIAFSGEFGRPLRAEDFVSFEPSR